VGALLHFRVREGDVTLKLFLSAGGALTRGGGLTVAVGYCDVAPTCGTFAILKDTSLVRNPGRKREPPEPDRACMQTQGMCGPGLHCWTLHGRCCIQAHDVLATLSSSRPESVPRLIQQPERVLVGDIDNTGAGSR
jgi:hypothetical protein